MFIVVVVVVVVAVVVVVFKDELFSINISTIFQFPFKQLASFTICKTFHSFFLFRAKFLQKTTKSAAQEHQIKIVILSPITSMKLSYVFPSSEIN